MPNDEDDEIPATWLGDAKPDMIVEALHARCHDHRMQNLQHSDLVWVLDRLADDVGAVAAMPWHEPERVARQVVGLLLRMSPSDRDAALAEIVRGIAHVAPAQAPA